jgi:hypothetical protein
LKALARRNVGGEQRTSIEAWAAAIGGVDEPLPDDPGAFQQGVDRGEFACRDHSQLLGAAGLVLRRIKQQLDLTQAESGNSPRVS